LLLVAWCVLVGGAHQKKIKKGSAGGSAAWFLSC
jgi:hypothetical protein